MKNALFAVVAFMGLGVAFGVWFGLFKNIHYFRDEIRQENRRDGRVGAVIQPPMPVEFSYQGKGCIHISKGYLDGDSGSVYLENSCDRKILDIRYDVKAYSSDGLVVASNWHYLDGSDDMEGGERREQTFSLDNRKSTVKVVFRIQSFNDLSR